VAVLLGCSSAPSNPTLCELAENRSAYADQEVTIVGTLLVSKHGINIEDLSCDNGVSVNWRNDSPDLREITDMVEGEIVERYSMRVRMTGRMKLVQSSGLIKGPIWQLQATSGQLLR
jgi:hypothetical protein